MKISTTDSMRITSLRFILMIFVVFLHAQLPMKYEGALQYVQRFFTLWASPSVNVFFMISGYLLFLKNDSYIVLLRKKCKGLFIPYLIWPATYLIIKVFPKLIASIFFVSFLKNPWKFYTTGWRFVDYLRYFFFYSSDFQHPFWAQFWFLRQLIFMVLLSPIILFFAKRFCAEFLIILIAIYLGAFNSINGKILYVIFSPLLFFYLGTLCAVYNISFFEVADKKFKWIFLLPVFILGFILQHIFLYGNGIFSTITILVACLIILKASVFLIPKQNNEANNISKDKKYHLYETLKKLSGFSFFLYAAHMQIFNPLFSWLYRKFIGIDNDIKLFGHFFFVSISDIFAAVFLGIILKKIFPKLFAIYNGGR